MLGYLREERQLDQRLTGQIAHAHSRVRDEARPDDVAAVHAAGRFTARERLARLLDPGSLIEYGALAGATTETDDDAHADGLVAVAGTVDGQPVVAASFDETVREGSQSDRNQRKLTKLLYLANTHRWPLVCFANGPGARPSDPLPSPPIMAQSRGRYDVYDGLAQMSGWAPTIAIVSGKSVDGHAGIAMLCDLVIATSVSEFGDTSLAPAVYRSAADYATTGDVDVIADDETSAIATAREFLALYFESARPVEVSDTYADIAEIIPDNRRRPYDMRRVVAAFADAGSTLELGKGWGRSMLTVLARLDGRTIGIFANQPRSPLAGAIDSAAADKASRFVELCDAYDIPLVSFVDNPGYMVGPQSEREGIARHHARPLTALHHRSVPLYSVQLRKAYGLGPYAMSGWGSARSVPDLRLAWPSVESGGMSLEGAAYLVKRKEILAADSQAEARAIRDAYADKVRDAASGLRAGRSMQFDDVITPSDTRERISVMVQRVPRALPTPHTAHKHTIDPR